MLDEGHKIVDSMKPIPIASELNFTAKQIASKVNNLIDKQKEWLSYKAEMEILDIYQLRLWKFVQARYLQGFQISLVA